VKYKISEMKLQKYREELLNTYAKWFDYENSPLISCHLVKSPPTLEVVASIQ